MESDYFSLPAIITLDDFGGNTQAFLEAVYEIFKRDFVDTKPRFRGKRCGLKKFSLIEGMEYTFYHFTHDGDIESERIPNLRRMERISWPRPMIDRSDHPYLKVWQNTRKSEPRILIFHENESFLVILADRGEYILPWTYFLIDTQNRKRRLLQEYEAYKNANAAQET
jgi:hypothetical protein